MRRSKYPSLGIMSFLEELAFGVVEFKRSDLYDRFSKHKIWKNRKHITKAIYDLKRTGYIKYKNIQNFIFTKKGERIIDFLRLERIALPEKIKDKNWRVIIFDIPEEKRGARDLFRGKLNELECYQLQKSVYVTPYDCEKEIAEIASILGITGYVVVLITKSLGYKEGIVRQFFG